jgi:hypothetical protein
MLEEQRHYEHPQLTAEQIEHDVAKAPSAAFKGENVILVGRIGERLAGLCWCVLFDPGTGLEKLPRSSLIPLIAPGGWGVASCERLSICFGRGM